MSNSITIDVDDYLDKDTKQQIVREEYAKAVRKHLSTEEDVRRVLSNAGYHTVYRLVDDVFNESSKIILSTKIASLLKSMTLFNVFNSPDAWGRSTNAAYDYLQKAIRLNYDVIDSVVKSTIAGEVAVSCKRDIKDIIAVAIEEQVGRL